MSFDSLGLSDSILKALEEQNFKKLYPIQEKSIPEILKGKDLLGIAKTGSGKTASYVLPILMQLKDVSEEKSRNVDALILVPTRELAVQVEEVVNAFKYAAKSKVKAMAVYGGVSINPQMKGLYGVNILIATPGRLLDLINSKAVSISMVNTLVLDEADKMLNLGFKHEMNMIFDLLPSKRQNLLFSATLSKDVKSLKQGLLTEPVVIKIEEETSDLTQIEQLGYFIEEEKKGPLLRYLINENNFEQVLVFVDSVRRADLVSAKLRKNGIDSKPIHSKISQGQRTEVLSLFKQGRLRVLVATDLLARGIDIEGLPCVVNYELPRSPKDYIHRIGRTGRAEEKGLAIAFVTEEAKHHFKVIQKKMKRVVTMVNIEALDL